MADRPILKDVVRDKVLAEPDMILDDPDVMRALVAANEKALGSNVIDLRGIAMERLEARLDRLEETHRCVIAAAYDNLSGANQIQRAVLRLLEPTDFEDFLSALTGEIAEILRVDAAVLVLESPDAEAGRALEALGHGIQVHPTGFIDNYLGRGRSVPHRQVTLRQLREGRNGVYGTGGNFIRSEGCLRLDLGGGRMTGLFVMGAEDPHRFAPSQGTDLLIFFSGALERAIRRWLA